VRLRVGALPQHPHNVLKYSLTWSTEGLINEYGNPCEAIVDGRTVEVRPLEGMEEIEIDGTLYEAFNTSGGLGSLAQSFGSSCESMDYKTIRYPGHCQQMRLLMNDLKLNQDRSTLKRILENAVPQTLQDVVIVYAAVTGMQNGELREENYVSKIYPQIIAGRLWSAIQVSTAAGLCAVLDLVLLHPERRAGLVTQESFRLPDILGNRFGSHWPPAAAKTSQAMWWSAAHRGGSARARAEPWPERTSAHCCSIFHCRRPSPTQRPRASRATARRRQPAGPCAHQRCGRLQHRHESGGCRGARLVRDTGAAARGSGAPHR